MDQQLCGWEPMQPVEVVVRKRLHHERDVLICSRQHAWHTNIIASCHAAPTVASSHKDAYRNAEPATASVTAP
jgi:hypothetical protein